MRKLGKFFAFCFFLGIFVVGFSSISKAETTSLFTNGKSISMKYDDFVMIDSIYKGYHAVAVSDKEVYSYIVNKGKKTSKKDKSVVTTTNGTSLHACGVGSCYVYLAKKENVDLVRKLCNKDYYAIVLNDSNLFEKYKKIKIYKVKVNVVAPKLTMIFLSGQSNAAGTCCALLGHHPEDSICCKDSTVYSTYASTSNNVGKLYTGKEKLGAISISNMNSIIPSSLISEKNVLGNKMKYSLKSLTSCGGGKTGMDSGLGYQWNKLTGDKVWVVNAAWGGTSIVDWTKGGCYYNRAISLYKKTLIVYNQEIKAGHYKIGNRLMYFIQGEKDINMNFDKYNTNFLNMYNGFVSNNIFDHFGMVSVRAHAKNNDNTVKDIKMTSPRIAQYLAAANPIYKNIYIVSNANEKWVDDKSVASYFKQRYPSGVYSYPLRKNSTLKKVATKANDVHPDVHYSQAGHNENAIDATYNMYRIVKNVKRTPKAHFVDKEGQKVTTLNIKKNSKEILIPVVDTFEYSKNIALVTSGINVKYDNKTGTILTTNKVGTSRIKIVNNITKQEIGYCNLLVK